MKRIALLVFGLVLSTYGIYAQSRVIKGKVNDDTGAPLGSVTVQVKGTKTGTQTDATGAFSIEVNSGGKVTLIFSSSGYTERSVSVEGNGPVNVSLAKNIATLDDVVVVGYQTIRRRDLTSSVSSVGAK
ncbi:MAG: hypothetical protein B7Z54_04685, partial [Sphingobacteriales bacterium 12-47-4]